MNFLIYLLVYPLLWLFSKLPFRIIYFLSDIVYLFVYHIIGYRKKAVRENLELVLTHLTVSERLLIEKKFFKHLCDMFLEMIKTMSITEKEINERYRFANFEVYKNLENKQKSISLMCAHYASYEWAVSLNLQISFLGYGVYKKLNNPYFDKLVKDIRAKFKANLITTKETIPTIIENANNKILGTYGFASDQSPKLSTTFHWAPFMGIVVPVHTGAEMIAKKYDMNVIFMQTRKLKRGFYECSFEVLADENVAEIPDYQITEKFLKLVEKQILEAPEFYLWTHKRWKHKKLD
jgi:Kdo2-lipid IVA lauroyltransferase/acyltransferase